MSLRGSRSGAPNSSSALQHHRAGIGASHVEVGGIGARIDPDALGWPAEAWRLVRLPAFHLDHVIIDVELEMFDEPIAELSEGQAVTHRNCSGANEAFPARTESETFDRSPRWIGPVENPYTLAMLGRRFEHVQKRRDVGIDAAAEILQVDQDRVERPHRLTRRSANLSVEAEYRHAVGRVGEVGRLHHIILEVSADAMLRPEDCRHVQLRPE
jgi:hypothetical protein